MKLIDKFLVSKGFKISCKSYNYIKYILENNININNISNVCKDLEIIFNLNYRTIHRAITNAAVKYLNNYSTKEMLFLLKTEYESLMQEVIENQKSKIEI